MKAHKIFNKIIICIIFLICISCTNKKQKNEIFINEYIERYLEANSLFASESIILSTIEYMDEIIAKEGNENLTIIYYDKAALLYKLKRYDEALETLFATDDDEIYDIYRATLFIRLGRNIEAIEYLENSIKNNKIFIKELMKSPNKNNSLIDVKVYIQGLIAMYILADMSYEAILDELTRENIATSQEAETLLQEILFLDDIQGGKKVEMEEVKEILLISTWSEL